MAHQMVGHVRAADRADDLADARGPLTDCPDSALVPPGSEPQCPVDITLAALGGRWTPLVLREFLRRDRATYSELSAALPSLSDKVLSDRLAQLTRAGIIERHRTAGWPPRVSYLLTRQGRALEPVLDSMWEWGTARRDLPS